MKKIRKFSFVTRQACPVCDCKDFLELFEEPFDSGGTYAFLESYYIGRVLKQHLKGAFFTLVQCNQCDLIFQKHVLENASLNYFYEHSLNSKTSLAKRESEKVKYFRGLLRSADLRFCEPKNIAARDFKVLDFGMGWGHWAAAAKAHGYSVFGAELSPVRIEFAKSLGVATVDPFSQEYKGVFDFINADQVFEHLIEPKDIILQLSQCLKPSGIIKIFVPNAALDRRSLGENYIAGKDAFHPLEHVNAFTRKSLNTLTETAGLRPLRIEECKSITVLRHGARFRFFDNPNWYYKKKTS